MKNLVANVGTALRRRCMRFAALVAVVLSISQAASAADPASALNQRLQDGSATLTYDPERGYLDSILEAFQISPTSQTLVFSKTSLQQAEISPTNPRALYFNDDVYIGWVPGGDRLEITAIDPEFGAEFYALKQSKLKRPRLTRDVGNCLACHQSHRTRNVPGLFLRSVFPEADGHPSLEAGSFVTTDSSPFSERYGGWYVTGTHGAMRHMGNVLPDEDATDPRALDTHRGANRTSLPPAVRDDRYPVPHSDLVALMVLTHQAQVHNDIARLAGETRAAEQHDIAMNQQFGRPGDYRSESTKRRIAKEARRLVRSLLMLDEFLLTSSVRGTSQFAARFQQLGPRDSNGRSFRELDLETRLFKYRCSPLIYSRSIESLPNAAYAQFKRELNQALSNNAKTSGLPLVERKVIRDILSETRPDLLVSP